MTHQFLFTHCFGSSVHHIHRNQSNLIIISAITGKKEEEDQIMCVTESNNTTADDTFLPSNQKNYFVTENPIVINTFHRVFPLS
jgi:hypothetical protein